MVRVVIVGKTKCTKGFIINLNSLIKRLKNATFEDSYGFLLIRSEDGFRASVCLDGLKIEEI